MRCAVVFETSGGNEAVNVLNFRRTSAGTITPTHLLELAEMVSDTYATEWPATASNGWTLVRLELRALDVADGPVLTYTTDLPLVGSRTSPALPDNVAACVTLYTGLAGRSRRGRVFHGGLTEDIVTANNFTTGYGDNLEELYDLLIFNGTGNLIPWVVLSYQADNAPRVTAQATPITSATIRDTRIDTMRSRLD